MSEVRDQLLEVAHDLFAIEVNTIVKPNMTATRMRNVAHTLLDIISEYDSALRSLEPPAPAESVIPKLSTQNELDVEAEVRKLADRARAAIRYWQVKLSPSEMGQQSREQETTESNYLLLCRIRDNCDQLFGLFDMLRARQPQGTVGIPELQKLSRQNATQREITLRTGERMQLRKIWEVGTETVLMQTVIHLNGDIFTRMQSQMARSTDEGKRILDIHNRGVSVAVSYWQQLSDLVANFFQNLFPSLKG